MSPKPPLANWVHRRVDRDATLVGRVAMQNVVKKYEKWRFLRRFGTVACEGQVSWFTVPMAGSIPS